MTWPSFPAAEVTSEEQSLVQMCGGFARTAVFLETWMFLKTQHTAGALQHGSDWVCMAQDAFEPLVWTTWADQHKAVPAQGLLCMC